MPDHEPLKKPEKKLEEKPENIDFSPFDAEANLRALCSIGRAMRSLSWNYAGDIERMARKLVLGLDAGRCVICPGRESGGFDIFEYTTRGILPLEDFFQSSAGQKWLSSFLVIHEDYASSEKFPNITVSTGVPCPPELLRLPCFVFPLRKYRGRDETVGGGLLILQESTEFERWNELFLESMVLLTDYLSLALDRDSFESLA